MPQGGGDGVGLETFDAQDVGGGVVGQTAGELLAMFVAHSDYVAFFETAEGVDDPDGQQAAALLLEGGASAVVQHDLPARLGGEADPAFPGGDGLPLGHEQRADQFAGADLGQVAGRTTAGDDHVLAGGRGDAGRLELAGHAALAHAGQLVADQSQDRRIEPS